MEVCIDSKETETMKGDVNRMQAQINADDAALKEVTQFRNQQQLLYHRDKTLLEKNRAELFGNFSLENYPLCKKVLRMPSDGRSLRGGVLFFHSHSSMDS